MSEKAGRYNIELRGQVIHVLLEGVWEQALDQRYVDDLARMIARLDGKPWGILVDMRDWSLTPPTSNLFAKNIVYTPLDRTDQVFECWLVNSMNQASELSPLIENLPHVRFIRVLTEEAAQDWTKLFPL